VVKRLQAGLALVGLFVAMVLVRGLVSLTLDALGWIGLAIGIAIIALVVVSALAGNSPRDPPADE
jgi:hypothetical protein